MASCSGDTVVHTSSSDKDIKKVVGDREHLTLNNLYRLFAGQIPEKSSEALSDVQGLYPYNMICKNFEARQYYDWPVVVSFLTSKDWGYTKEYLDEWLLPQVQYAPGETRGVLLGMQIRLWYKVQIEVRRDRTKKALKRLHSAARYLRLYSYDPLHQTLDKKWLGNVTHVEYAGTQNLIEIHIQTGIMHIPWALHATIETELYLNNGTPVYVGELKQGQGILVMDPETLALRTGAIINLRESEPRETFRITARTRQHNLVLNGFLVHTPSEDL